MSDQATKIPLTAIILTYNEAINISACLGAMARVDDVVIVDSLSTDDTLARAMAQRANVRVFSHAFQNFGLQRNWALDHCAAKHPWILFVDADEYCTAAFLDEVAAFIALPDQRVGAFVAGKNYFLGRWLKRTTFYPSYQLRLLKLGFVRYRKEGHGQKEITDGPLHYFRKGWRHEGFSHGVFHWIERHNKYSSAEIELLLRLRKELIPWRAIFAKDPIVRRRALKILGAKLPFRPIMRFSYTYFLRRGFMDGMPGFLYCLLRVSHDIHIVVKMKEQCYRQRNSNKI